MSPLDHQGMNRQRKGRESNPHVLADPDLAGRRVTSSAHPSVARPSSFVPRHSGCSDALYFPNDEGRMTKDDEWSRGELNPVAVFARHSARPRATPVRGNCRSDLGGSRTHTPCGARLSTGPVYQFQHEVSQLRTRESNPASRLMRPGRAPARPQCVASGDGGIRTHTVHVLSVATPASWSTSPCRDSSSRVTRGGIEPPLSG